MFQKLVQYLYKHIVLRAQTATYSSWFSLKMGGNMAKKENKERLSTNAKITPIGTSDYLSFYSTIQKENR
ncbi:MAG: hypothetical protein LBM71_02285 [Elusimicrobiota bacterium]|jgi:hypothetical protein|nr:hypothetical protein [Elusimicrobiota bacterium]